MKYAIIQTGGKQYKVKEGQELDVEKLPFGSSEEIKLDKVLLVRDGEEISVGTPFLSSARVEVEVVESFKGKKIHVYKYKSKSRYRRKTGHRQLKTKIKIKKINLNVKTQNSNLKLKS